MVCITSLRTLDHMQERYSPNDVEKASHDNWEARDAYRVTEHAKAADGSSKPKFYACSMLPYSSAEHTSELQSLMRISYAVFCLKKQTIEHNPSIPVNNREEIKTSINAIE